MCCRSGLLYLVHHSDVRFLIFNQWTTVNNLLLMIALLRMTTSDDRQPYRRQQLCTSAAIHDESTMGCNSRRRSYAWLLVCRNPITTNLHWSHATTHTVVPLLRHCLWQMVVIMSLWLCLLVMISIDWLRHYLWQMIVTMSLWWCLLVMISID